MPDITDDAQPVFSDGLCGRSVLYAVKNCSGGDTFDVAAHIAVVKSAGLVSVTGTGAAAVEATGTVITIPAGIFNDGVWVMVVGVAA